MKKKNAAKFETAAQPTGPITTINAVFDIAAKHHFPDNYADPDDQKLLRSMFLLGYRSGLAQLRDSTLVPLDTAAKIAFDELCPPAPAAPPIAP